MKDIGFPVFDYSIKRVVALSIPFLEYPDDSQTATYDEARGVLRNAVESITAPWVMANSITDQLSC